MEMAETEEPTETPTETPEEKRLWYCIEHGEVTPRESKGRMFCPECGKLLSKEPYPEEKGPPLKPPEVEMTEAVVESLRAKLHTVYGISKNKAAAVIDTVKDNPGIALNPMGLFVHIKQLERRANDYHLWTVLNSIFEGLRSAGWTGGPLPAFPAFQQQLTQQYPTTFGYGAPGYQYGPQYGYQYGHGYQRGYPPVQPRGRPPTPMKVVVEGQEIETDMAGYMAYRRWESDRKRDEQEAREHEMRMKRLEAEIKKIESEAARGGKPAPEEKVEVEVEGTKYKVPVSLAPAYLSLRKPRESEDVKELKGKVEKLTGDLHSKEIGGLKDQIQSLSAQVGDLSKKPSLSEELEALEKTAGRLGMKRGGRTALDVLETGVTKIDERAKQMLQRLPVPGEEFKPEVTRGPTEREEKAREIEKRLKKGRELLEAEDKLLRAASKLK